MDVVAVGSVVAACQLGLAGALDVAFRRAWSEALRVGVKFPTDLPTPAVATGEVWPGVYRPDRRQALVVPTLREPRSLAALAVQLHEIGHYRQHLAQPLAVQLHWPLRTLATLVGGLAVLLVVGGLLAANRGLADLGVLVGGGSLVATCGLVILEWDASRRGIATLGAATPAPPGLRLLLLLAALTYLGLAWTLLLPILQPEAACSLPSSDDGADLSRTDRIFTRETRRGNHGERGTGDSEDQPGSAQSAAGRDEASHDRGRTLPG